MNSSLKNGLLMLAPCLLLVGVGFLLKNRKPAIPAKKPEWGLFMPYIRAVRPIPLEPSEVKDGYDTKIEVELDASGSLPSWWNTGFSKYSGEPCGLVVTQKGKNRRQIVASAFCCHPHLDKNSKKWFSTYLLKVAPIKSSAGDIYLYDHVLFYNHLNVPVSYSGDNPYRLNLDYKVRANGISTPIP